MGSDAEERTPTTSAAPSPVGAALGHSWWLEVHGLSPARPWSLTALAATEAEHRSHHGIRHGDCVDHGNTGHNVGAASDGPQAATAVVEPVHHANMRHRSQ